MVKTTEYCPLCQQLNRCAILAGQNIENCWCHEQALPDKKAVSVDLSDAKACLCQQCLTRLKEEAQSGYKRVD